MNLNRRVPNGLPGGVRGRKFYYFLLLDYVKKKNTPFSECAFHEIERDENTVAYLQALKVYHVSLRTFCTTKTIHIISIQPL
jgi:hypothetical protein